MKKKVILINPTSGKEIGATISPPHALLAIAAELLDTYKVEILDQRINYNLETILEEKIPKTNLVGITCMGGPSIDYALNLSKKIKLINKETIIVWGGIFPSTFPDICLNNSFVDFIVRGEGENKIKNILESSSVKDFSKIAGISYKKDGKIIHNKDSNFVTMNELKETPWQLVNVENYIHSNVFFADSKRELDIGQLSRGCTFQCGFCYNLSFNKGRYRKMSSDKASKIILNSVEKFNLDGVWIRDDNFFLDKKWSVKIASKIISSGKKFKYYSSGIQIKIFNMMSDKEVLTIKESGCDGFRFGVESGSKRIQKLIGKNISWKEVLNANERSKNLGIVPYYSFMLAFPTETIKEAIDTVKLAIKIKKENPNAKLAHFNLFIPVPGTPLFDKCIKLGMKSPKDLNEWAKVTYLTTISSFGNVPYVKKEDFEMMKNIAAISYVNSDLMWMILPTHLKLIILPLKILAKLRWNNLWFKFCPELNVLIFLGNLFFKLKRMFS